MGLERQCRTLGAPLSCALPLRPASEANLREAREFLVVVELFADVTGV